MRLTIPDASAVVWRRWDDELVVFNRVSGDTHLLSGPAGRILEMLLHAPHSIGDVKSTLASSGQQQDVLLSNGEIEQALGDLRRLGLLG